MLGLYIIYYINITCYICIILTNFKNSNSYGGKLKLGESSFNVEKEKMSKLGMPVMSFVADLDLLGWLGEM